MIVVRCAAVIPLLLAATACGSAQHASKAKVLVCGSPGAAVSACGHPPKTYYTSALYAIDRNPPTKIAGAPPANRYGFWVPDRVFPAPNGRTVLAQWSGECEGQSTYLISRRTGKIRLVFLTESQARGWSKDGRARVFLAAPGSFDGEYGYKPGLYLVDATTMKRTLVRPARPRQGC